MTWFSTEVEWLPFFVLFHVFVLIPPGDGRGSDHQERVKKLLGTLTLLQFGIGARLKSM